MKVYYFRRFHIVRGEMEYSQRPATLEAIARSRGEPLMSTALEIDEAELDSNGFRKREV